MKQIFQSGLSLLFVFSLLACGKSEDQRREKKVDDVNAKITRLNSISGTLSSSYAIVVQTYSTWATTEIPSTLVLEDIETLRGLLKEYISNGRSVLAIASSDDKIYFFQRDQLRNYVHRAEDYLDNLKDYEEKIRSAAAEKKGPENDSDAGSLSLSPGVKSITDQLHDTHLVVMRLNLDTEVFQVRNLAFNLSLESGFEFLADSAELSKANRLALRHKSEAEMVALMSSAREFMDRVNKLNAANFELGRQAKSLVTTQPAALGLDELRARVQHLVQASQANFNLIDEHYAKMGLKTLDEKRQELSQLNRDRQM